MQQDQQWMERACQIALLGQGRVEPNPMVGCVLVRDGNVIGEGYHAQFGGPHAEQSALANLSTANAEGATAYVSLEPCCHYGKTPPCTDALVNAKVARVCCALLDPFQKVSGKGVERLRAAGIHVDVGCGQHRAREVLAPYLKRIRTGLPFVIAKWAMSLDGKIATLTGDSRWISSPTSRQHAHSIRGQVDAIIVGSRTASRDDPLLTARPAGCRTALRVVVDSMASLSPTSQLVQTARDVPVLVWSTSKASVKNVQQLVDLGCHVHLCDSDHRLLELLRYLADKHQATNVLCEGGGQLLGHLFDNRLMDEIQVYICPKLIGGRGAPTPLSDQGVAKITDGPALRICQRAQFEDDAYIRARLQETPGLTPAELQN